MKDERVINPYQQAPSRTPKLGQADISRESSPEATGTPSEETVKLSPHMAAFARKEQKFRQQQAAFAKERETIAAEKAELAQLRAMKEKLAAKDYSALDGMVDYNEYSQHQLNKINGADPVKEELEQLRAKMSQLEKTTEDSMVQQYEAGFEERRIAAKALIANSDQFPKIKKANMIEAIVHHIRETWDNDEIELSVEDAAKEVERELGDRAKKWASLLEEEKAMEAEGERRNIPPMKPALKTLTNQVSAADITSHKPLYAMSDSEKWAEARRRAEAKLALQRR